MGLKPLLPKSDTLDPHPLPRRTSGASGTPRQHGDGSARSDHPSRCDEDVLTAQVDAEDRRLRARAEQIRTESQKHSCIEDNETTPWLKFTKWPELFIDRPLEIITATARLPSRTSWKNEKYLLGDWRGAPVYSSAATERRIRILMSSVDDVFDRAAATLTCTPYRSRCWAASYWKDEFRHRPLRSLPASTRQSYKARWKQFICFIFRALSLGNSKLRQIYNLPLRRDDIVMMQYILDLTLDGEDDEEVVIELDVGEGESEVEEDADGRDDTEDEVNSDMEGCYDDDADVSYSTSHGADEEVEKGEEDEDSEDGEEDEEDNGSQDVPSSAAYQPLTGWRLRLSEALFQLSMMFWTHQSSSGTMESSTIVYFTAVLGVHRSSPAYRDAYHATPMLAALVWVGRLFFLEYSLPLYSYDTLLYPWPARQSYSSQPERLQTIRAKYMLRGCYSPLSELIEMKAMGRSILNREGVPGNLTWAADGRSFTIGNNKVVRLSEFCTVYQDSITRLREGVANMMLGWEPEVDLSKIHDDLTCRVSGWSFLDDPENKLIDTYKRMARRAWSALFDGKQMAKGGHWLPGPCQLYLEAGIKMLILAFNAVHITSSLPGRGSEMNSIRVRNTELTIRNVFIRESRLLVVISYTKSRASNNHSFYVVRYLHPDVATAVFLCIAYIRPFMDFISNQLELKQYHSTEFLFPDPMHKRRHLSSLQITASLRHVTRELHTPWTISLYRQAAIAIAKRYISELIEKRRFYFPSDASTPIRMIAAGVSHHPRMLLTTYAIHKALPARLQPELLEMYRQLSLIWQEWNQQYYKDHCLRLPDGTSAETNTALQEDKLSITNLPAAGAKRQYKRPSSSSNDLRARKKTRQALDLGGKNHNASSILESATAVPPEGFIYNAEYKIMICIACESMIQPGRSSIYDHLNRHRIMGEVCKAYVKRISAFELLPFKELRMPRQVIRAVKGLRIHAAYKCEICTLFTLVSS